MTTAELKYLLTISELYDGAAGVKLTSIATKMNVTKVSVSRAVERLEKNGYIGRDDKNKVVINECGYEQLEKYNILIGWFRNHLQQNCKVPVDIAYQDAIGVACAMSEESLSNIAEYINTKRIKGRGHQND